MGFKLRNRKLAKSDEDAYDAATLSWRVAAAHAVAEGILHDVYAGCIDRLQARLLQRQIMLNRAQFEDLCHRSQYFLVLTNSVSASKARGRMSTWQLVARSKFIMRLHCCCGGTSLGYHLVPTVFFRQSAIRRFHPGTVRVVFFLCKA